MHDWLTEQQNQQLEQALEQNLECPFSDPNFELDLDQPCPVCGSLGTVAQAYCVDEFRGDRNG